MDDDRQNSMRIPRIMIVLNILAFLYLAFIIFAFTPFTNNLDGIKIAALFIWGPVLLIVYIVSTLRGALRVFPGKPLIFLLGYVAILCLSTLIAGEPYSWAGWIALMKIVAFLGGFFIFFGLMRTKQDIFRSLFILILLTFGTSAFGLFHHFGGIDVLYKFFDFPRGQSDSSLMILFQTFICAKDCMMGTLLHCGIFANFLMMLIPISLFFMIAEKGRRVRIFAAVAVLLMIVCLIIPSLQRKINPETLFSSRAVIWKGGWEMFLHGPGGENWYEKEHPQMNPRTILIGCGPGSFGILFPRYRRPDYRSYNISNVTLSAHNRYLDLLCESGILGFACYMGLIFTFFAMGVKGLRNTKDAQMRLIILGFLCGIFMVCFFDFLKQSAGWDTFGVFFWIVFGMGFGVFDFAVNDENAPVFVSSKTKTILTILCLPVIIIAIFSAIYGVHYWISEIHYEKGLTQAKWGESFEEEIRRIEKNPLLQSGSKEEREKRIFGMKKSSEQYYRSAIAEFEKSIKMNPTRLSSYYKLAHTYNQTGDTENALKTYLALQKYSPDYAEVHYNLGIVYSTLSDKTPDQSVSAKYKSDALRELKIAARMSTKQSIQERYRRALEKKGAEP